MDNATTFCDDDYDVISNPGHLSLESSLDDLPQEAIRELPACEEAQDKFETTRWSATDIQGFILRGLGMDKGFTHHKKVRVYVDGVFDQFDVAHALQLRQAKLAFSAVHLMVGVFSDETLCQNSCISVWPEVERVELVRHCRWVDEVVKDAPWALTVQFIQDKNIDFACINEGTSVDPLCDKARVKGYDELKRQGKIIMTRRTNGLQSQQRRCLMASTSQRATPTLTESPRTPGAAISIDVPALG